MAQFEKWSSHDVTVTKEETHVAPLKKRSLCSRMTPAATTGKVRGEAKNLCLDPLGGAVVFIVQRFTRETLFIAQLAQQFNATSMLSEKIQKVRYRNLGRLS